MSTYRTPSRPSLSNPGLYEMTVLYGDHVLGGCIARWDECLRWSSDVIAQHKGVRTALPGMLDNEQAG